MGIDAVFEKTYQLIFPDHPKEFELKIVGHDFQQGDMEQEGGARIEARLLPPNCLFSFAQIVLSSVEDFRQLLNNYPMTENEKEQFKCSRRMGKNRLLTAKSRRRRIAHLEELRMKKAHLENGRRRIMANPQLATGGANGG